MSDGRGAGARFARSAEGRIGLVLLGGLAAVAVLSPVLASGRPLISRDAAGWHLPALAGYPVVGRFFRTAPSASERPVLAAPIPYSPDGIDLRARLEPPSRRHWLGTDDLGRDVLARMVAAAPVSLSIGIVASGIALVLGLLLGGLAGYAGGVVDLAVSRVMEIVLCFPTIFLILALVALLPQSAWTVMVAIGVTSWPDEARYARAEILKAKDLDFTRAARVAGAGPGRILFRHLLPNAMAPVLVSATFGVASAILAEAGLSFLGVGLPPGSPSWGALLGIAETYIDQAWWLVLFPGLAIFATVAAYNLIGEAWREALDPERPAPGLEREVA
jgi:peptide/nickel transport system permease protein